MARVAAAMEGQASPPPAGASLSILQGGGGGRCLAARSTSDSPEHVYLVRLLLSAAAPSPHPP
eukprot:7800193-Pyramimonas_sp.AAC.1